DARKAAHQRGGVAEDLRYAPLSDGDEEVTLDARKEDADELGRILRHLITTGRSPPGFDPDRRN
ncbi:MAG: hypothetical protein R6U25_02160, partial [Alkalispirochaeta sp.]